MSTVFQSSPTLKEKTRCPRPFEVLVPHSNGTYPNFSLQPLRWTGKLGARSSTSGALEHLRCFGILVYLLIPVFCFFFSYNLINLNLTWHRSVVYFSKPQSGRCVLTLWPLTTTLLPKIWVPSALVLPHCPERHLQHSFLWLVGRQMDFTFRWLPSLKFSEIKLKFPCDRNAHIIAQKSQISLPN
jgi:hypothetical protein